MQLSIFKPDEQSLTYVYNLTWDMDWRHCIAFVTAILHADMANGEINSIRLVDIENDEEHETDISEQIEEADFDLMGLLEDTPHSGISVYGVSSITECPTKITILADAPTCMLQVLKSLPENALASYENAYDRYMDSLEILTYMSCVETSGSSPEDWEDTK